MKKKNTLNYPKSAATGSFQEIQENEFERTMVNEPSVFEPLKFYCISFCSENLCLNEIWINGNLMFFS